MSYATPIPAYNTPYSQTATRKMLTPFLPGYTVIASATMVPICIGMRRGWLHIRDKSQNYSGANPPDMYNYQVR